MGRVRVADDVWAGSVPLADNRPISEFLGELVGGEVDRYRSRRLRDGQLDLWLRRGRCGAEADHTSAPQLSAYLTGNLREAAAPIFGFDLVT